MKRGGQFVGLLVVTLMAMSTRTHGQTSEFAKLFRDFEARADGATPGTLEEAGPTIERLTQGSKESVAEAMPIVVRAARDSHASVRRLAVSAIFTIALRVDGKAFLSPETGTLAALLTDSEIPIRGMDALTIDTLGLDASSSLVPVMRMYLERQDAAATIGPGVAGELMKIAPDNVECTSAVVRFMRREDHTVRSRIDVLYAIRTAHSKNKDVGREVARYAQDASGGVGEIAIGVLSSMGKDVILDNQQVLSQIAGDGSRASGVRGAASKMLMSVR